MAERVFFVSYPHVPEPEYVPALRTVIDQLERSSFEVAVFRWPYLLGERDEPTWQGASIAIARQLRPGDHLVAFGCGLWIALSGLQQASIAVSSIVCATLAIPSRTLEVLGLDVMARVGDQSRAVTNFRWVRRRLGMMMQQAEGHEVDGYANLFLNQVAAERHDEFLDSHEAFDVTAELNPVSCPALYLELNRAPGEAPRAMDVGALLPQPEGEDRELFRRFVPRVTFAELSVFPTRLHEAESSRELWEQMIPFMRKNSAKRIPLVAP